MKRLKPRYISLFVVALTCFNARGQILENGGRIDPYWQIEWHNAGLLPDSRPGGLLPATPTQTQFLEIINPNGNVSQQVRIPPVNPTFHLFG